MGKIKYILWELCKKRGAFSFTSFSKLIFQLVIAGIGIKRFSSLVSIIFFLLIGQGLLAQTQLGSDIDGDRNNNVDSYGGTVDLSSDGTRVVIGDPQYSPSVGSCCFAKGRVRVYDFNGNNWVQVGADLLELNGGFIGNDVEISSDGSRIAVGIPRYSNGDIDGNGYSDLMTGRVRIYDYTPTGTSSWTQIGGDILGEDYGSSDLTYNQRSGESISLSSDGSTIAIGGYKENVSPGIVRIFRLIGNTWTKIGGNLVGENNDDEFGTCLLYTSPSPRDLSTSRMPSSA